MKTRSRIATAVATALSLSVLSQSADAQVVGPPSVRSVSDTPWFDPGRVTIRGDNFSLVTRVTVDGVDANIRRIGAASIVVDAPEPVGPGFGEVRVFNPFGPGEGSLPYTPAVRAERRGGRMDVTLMLGEPGLWVLYFGFDELQDPLEVPGTLFHRVIDLGSPSSGVLASGVLTDGDTVTLPGQPVPREMGMVGQPFLLQSLARLGFAPRRPSSRGGTVARVGDLVEGAPLPDEVRSFSNAFQVETARPMPAGNGGS